MAILGSVPVLNCQSIDETLSFYRQLLQFVIVNKREQDNQLKWAHIMHGDTSLMLQLADSQTVDMPRLKESKINLYFFVNNINDVHHYIKAKYKDVSQVVETDYRMQEFFLIDPEGNKVVLGQKM